MRAPFYPMLIVRKLVKTWVESVRWRATRLGGREGTIMSYRKTCDEIRALTLRQLHAESMDWLELMRDEEPTDVVRLVGKDLAELGKRIQKLGRRRSGPEYEQIKELLVGHCVKQRQHHGDRTPAAVRSMA